MKLGARDRRALVGGGVFLAAVLIAWFGLLPAVEHWQNVRAQTQVTAASLDSLQEKVTRLNQTRDALAAAYGPGLSKPIEAEPETRLAFRHAVVDVLKKAGVKTKSIKPQREKPIRAVPGTVLLSMKVNGQCQLPQLAKFLAETQQADMLILIDRIHVTRNNKKPQELMVDIVLATVARREQRT